MARRDILGATFWAQESIRDPSGGAWLKTFPLVGLPLGGGRYINIWGMALLRACNEVRARLVDVCWWDGKGLTYKNQCN